ncbi:MAG: ABC transporter ATP-binding protein [Clostridia bacterium]
MLKIMRKLKPFAGGIVLVLVFIFLQSIADLQLPNFMSDIVNNGIQSGDTAYILRRGVLMLLVALGGAACTIFASYMSSRIAMRYGNKLRSELFTKATNFSLNEFDKLGTATLITRTTNDVTQVQQVMIMLLRMVVSAPMMCVGGLIMALSKDATLTLILLVSIPLLMGVIFLITRRAMPMFKSMQRKVDKLNLVMRESLTGTRVIRAFNRTEHDCERFDEANRDITDTAIRVNRIMSFLMPAMMLIMNITTVAIMYFGATRISAGNMQIGNLMAVSQYIMQIMFSLVMLSMMFVMLPRAAASADRINELLEVENTVLDPKKAGHANGARGTLAFNNVAFKYAGATECAISDITFTARAGETVAIIGGTGSGKSTILNLIPRFYDATDGSVTVDGLDVREYNRASLREKIAFTPQKALLFSGTVRENMHFGRESATDDEIWHALSIAQAEFVRELPGGLDFEVSQGGSNLSGGQKQRLTIARALVSGAEIYLFDDNFSALDYKTDAALRHALAREISDATVIIVAQRVSTVRYADRILVLDEGRLAGVGTHDELKETCEVYREILSSQLTEEELA